MRLKPTSTPIPKAYMLDMHTIHVPAPSPPYLVPSPVDLARQRIELERQRLAAAPKLLPGDTSCRFGAKL